MFDLLKIIFNEYIKNGQSINILLIPTIILGILFFVYKILKGRGYFDTIITKKLDEIIVKINLIEQNSHNSSKSLLHYLKQISDKQESYLTNEQVGLATDLIFKFVKADIILCLIDIFNSNNRNKILLEENLKDKIEVIINDVDNGYFKLPNTGGEAVTTIIKFKTFNDKDFYSKTAELLINESLNTIMEQSKINLDTIISKWRTRI
jgi:hypothetical protein